MSINVLGERKRVRYDEGLVDVVNRKAELGELEEEMILPVISGVLSEDVENFNKSLDLLKSKGYSSHPCPADYANCISNTSSSFKNSLMNAGFQWTDKFLYLTEWDLYVFTFKDPVLFNNEEYIITESYKTQQSISGHLLIDRKKYTELIKGDKAIPLSIINREIPYLIESLFSKKLEELPEEIRNGTLELPAKPSSLILHALTFNNGNLFCSRYALTRGIK